MSFSQATITHTFNYADGTPASGQVRAKLTQRMTNGTSTVIPAELVANLNASGQLSLVLYANNDSGTVPSDTQWEITLAIQGMTPQVYLVTVSTGGGTVDLGTLLPGNEQVN